MVTSGENPRDKYGLLEELPEGSSVSRFIGERYEAALKRTKPQDWGSIRALRRDFIIAVRRCFGDSLKEEIVPELSSVEIIYHSNLS